eukprot:CAMPEP_0116906706 /NCGR_PEP_ID=MMETSP0467-20121206/12673_1 /TAXON_ID=283647 /ORGANISM="Mesodinium pulex, Strain SPMC105" /LENGTH=432 /DNA_ID=CAMNT_0004581591 /DNA_START=204 /DNA_END=1503 /DNA_ORIENTATION=+
MRKGIFESDFLADLSRELLSHSEGLRQHTLDFACAGHHEFVLLAQLVHSEDGDDVLERLVVLQEFLGRTRDVVVALAHDHWVQHTGGGVERVDGRLDAQLGQGAGQHGGGVQEGEGCGRRRVSQVVGRHVHGLHGSDGTLGSRADALLQRSQVGGQGGLVSNGRGDAAQQGGHLGAGLGEAEDIVYEQQHVLVLLVAELLCNGESSQTHPGSSSWGLIHLALDQGATGTRAIHFNHAGFYHFVIQVVAFAGPFADACENGVSSVGLGNIVDQLHDEHGLSDSGSSKESDLASPGVGSQQVDDLDFSDQEFSPGDLLGELGRIAVDGHELVGLDGAARVDGFPYHIDDAAQGGGSDGDHDGGAGVADLLAAHQSVGSVHGDGPDFVVAQVLSDFEHQSVFGAIHLQSIQNLGQSRFKFYVHYCPDYLTDPTWT